MGVLTDTGSMPPVTSAYFNRKLLKRARFKQLHSRFAQRKELPSRSTKTMIFRRLPALAVATTPLIEGAAPRGVQPTHEEVSCTVKQYGSYVVVSDLVKVVVEHPLLNDIADLLGQQSGETIDTLHRDDFAAGTTVFYGGTGTQRSDLTTTTHKVTTALLDRICRYLAQQNGEMYNEIVSGSTKVGTLPVRDSYWAIITPEIYFTLQTLTGFISVEQYGSGGGIVRGEVGAYKNLRFLMTTNGKKFLEGGGSVSGDVNGTSNADVHCMLVFAMDAVAYVPLEGMSLQNIIHPIGSAGAADPLDQVGTSGWKHAGCRVILKNEWLVRAEVTVGKLAP